MSEHTIFDWKNYLRDICALYYYTLPGERMLGDGPAGKITVGVATSLKCTPYKYDAY